MSRRWSRRCLGGCARHSSRRIFSNRSLCGSPIALVSTRSASTRGSSSCSAPAAHATPSSWTCQGAPEAAEARRRRGGGGRQRRVRIGALLGGPTAEQNAARGRLCRRSGAPIVPAPRRPASAAHPLAAFSPEVLRLGPDRSARAVASIRDRAVASLLREPRAAGARAGARRPRRRRG